MRRKRYQKGSVGERKHGRRKVWVAQWWEQGVRRSKVLGHCSEITKSQADALMASILQPLNEAAGQRQVPIYTFGAYLDQSYLPVCRRKWKESTRMTTESTINFHLRPALGPLVMRNITRDQLQAFLDKKAEKRSRSLVEHLRWHLRAIFRMAASEGVVDFNPADSLFASAREEAESRVMTPEDVRLALSVLEVRERLIFRMAVFDGMRPGEILAVRLGKISENSILVDRRVYKGNLDTPKGRKGKSNARLVALSPGSIADLRFWRSLLPDDDPDSWLFPSENGTPLWRDNVWYRYLKPKLDTVGLGWATFQVLRRTNASLARKAKVDDKVAADQRGHTLGVSLEVYSISDLEQKLAAVAKLESEVIR
jgi:integrase